MDKPISVGDLVVVVRSCCDRFMEGVTIFKVAVMRQTRPADLCTYCSRALPNGTYAADNPQYSGAPVGWLKRIPPLDELEGEKRDEEITA